ncbi:MAG: hypothetical protein R3F54_15750 [Alphaproteobacteria bacterium]
MRATAFTLLVGFLAGFSMIEAYLRFDDYSAHAVDYAYHEWDGRTRRVMATAEDLADPRQAIVFLGDSMLAGIKCGPALNLAGHFSHAMHEVAPGYKAINLGSANTSVFAYLDQLQGYEAAEGTPAGVIVMLYTNDIDVIEPRMCPVADVIERADALSPEEKAGIRRFCAGIVPGEPAASGSTSWFSIGGPVDRWLHGVSYGYRFFREASAQLAVGFSGDETIGRLRYPGLWSDLNSLEFRLIDIGLQAIRARVRRDAIPMMVAFYPPVEHLSVDNPMYPATERAGSELERRLGVAVLNGFDAYLDDPRASRNMTRSLTDAHPSCLGHQILAEWLMRKFDDIGGFDGPSLDDSSTLTATGSAIFDHAAKP